MLNALSPLPGRSCHRAGSVGLCSGPGYIYVAIAALLDVRMTGEGFDGYI
jgi:hypothetical protein